MTEQKKTQQKKKFPWGTIIFFLCCLALGAFIGIAMGESEQEPDFSKFLIAYVAFIAAFLVHLVVHEAGHMVAGLMTGYRFLSFRIGSLMWEKQKGGKIHRSHFSLAGTGGQCLMQPPKYNNGNFPYVWYNLSGGLANFILSAICGALLFVVKNDDVQLCLWMVLISGVLLGATNLIPFSSKTVNNDGSNIVSISKSPAAKRAFWLQMQSNYCIAMGQRLKDMPDEWFEKAPENERNNMMITAMEVLACNRLMDQLNVQAAEQEMRSLVNDPDVAGIYRSLLALEIAFCELLRGVKDGYAKKMEEKELAAFMKTMKNFPSVLRAQYAKAVLADNDQQTAEKYLAAFEKMAKTYPHPSELAGERELIQLVNEAAQKSPMDA